MTDGTMPELVIRWSDGQLDLNGWNDDYLIEASADDLDFGNIEAVRRELQSALLDGSVSVKERDSNRTVSLRLRVTGPSLDTVAEGEAALALLDGRRCELVWTPPDALAAPAVFVCVSSDLRHEGGKYRAEAQKLQRFYALALECLPHTFSDEYVTIAAVEKDAHVRSTVDTCSSTTGWTATGASLVASGGVISVIPTVTVGSTTYSATRTGPVDLTTLRYLGIEAGYEYDADTVGYPDKVEVQFTGGTWFQLPASTNRDVNYQVFNTTGIADPTIEAIRITFTTSGISSFIREIVRQDAPLASPNRQQLRTLTVPGSARTPASLLVASPTTGLGTTIVYSGPAYDPGLTRGATNLRSAAPGNLSGGILSILPNQTRAIEIPAIDFVPGDHAFWVRAGSATGTASGELRLTVKLMTAAGVQISTRLVSATNLSLTTYSMHPLGSAELPPAALPELSTAVVRIELWLRGDATGEFYVDELLAFNRTEGDLTIVEADNERRVWLDPATLELDHPMAFRGTVADKRYALPINLSDSLKAWPGAHRIESPETYLYTGTSGASDSVVSGTFRPAWFLHPAGLS